MAAWRLGLQHGGVYSTIDELPSAKAWPWLMNMPPLDVIAMPKAPLSMQRATKE